METKSKRVYETLGVISVTDSTEIHLTKCFEEKEFKGYYLSKSYMIKDSTNRNKFVKIFAKGAYRIDTLNQLRDLTKMLIEAVKKEKGEENNGNSN